MSAFLYNLVRKDDYSLLCCCSLLAPEDHYAASPQQSLLVKEPELNQSGFAGDVFQIYFVSFHIDRAFQ